ncbi:AI-2E family transporter [Neolewinella litorea]|uniref:AI-2E family transporter n=1 Tax=Neolewinella litorea TaxID=2562452 RepID=A0A4V3XLN6_9BACT|nr:AI-2E family transporter [Neolewinella litorea]THH41593.1 AI-2E family transporter [Neolewinella litorea]
MAKSTKKIRPPSSSGSVSFERLAHFMICLSIVLFALYAGSSFFIPIAFGLFFSLMLKPVCHQFECNLSSRIISVVLTLITAGMVVFGVLVFFINQIREILTEADDIFAGLQETVYEWAEYGGHRFGLSGRDVEQYIDEAITSVSDRPLGILSTGLSTSGVLLANFSLVMIYTFFFLLYRTPIKNFLLGQLQRENQEEGLQTLTEVQQVAKNYLGGMGLVMLILGTLNSIGLFAIGIDYYLIWGFLAAILGVIPYIGTAIGGLLPFIFAIATTETIWQPLAVIVLYITVQFIEGNFITPKVLGNSVKINALAAIISVLIGSIFWGIAGVILAIPLLAMVRIILTHIEPLRPVALLLSDDLYKESGKFLKEFNEPRYRLSNIFSGRSSLSLLPRRRTTTKPPKRVGHADPQVVADPESD